MTYCVAPRLISKALHGRLKSQRDGTGGKLTVDPPFSFRRERGTGKYRGGNSWRDGTGRYFSRQNSWRDGTVFFFFRGGTGRGFFFRDGTGRSVFFPEAGRGGCIFFRGGTGRLYFFSKRDGTGLLRFFSAGTGRLYSLFAPGRAFFF